MSSNPFDDDYEGPSDLFERKPKPTSEVIATMKSRAGLIKPARPKPEADRTRIILTEPGAYPDIAAEDYHGNPNLLPGPSLSSSGCKLILSKSPLHFWHSSPLNPNREEQADKRHFAVGRAAHDIILLNDRWAEFYHVLPEGFSRTKTAKMACAIEEADAAIEAGLTILSKADEAIVLAVAESLQKNPLAVACLTDGVPEETLVWQDPTTGVWLRARPDFRPNSLLMDRSVRVVPDLKFIAGSQADPESFGKAIYNFGYHQSAAFYSDGLHAIYGVRPSHWLHIVVEKEPPYCVSLYELPGEDIERGRILNRRGINRFAQCLKEDRWPGYADNPIECGLPNWARMRTDDFTPEEAAAAEAG